MKKILFTLLWVLPLCVDGQDIVHIAGGLGCDNAGDGGLALNASFSEPVSVCRDAMGNLYIGNVNSPSVGAIGYVRKIDAATGIISAIAGSTDTINAVDTLNNIPATNALIVWASGLCIDNAGNLLICSKPGRVQKLDLLTGIITTLAGYFQSSSSTGDGGPAINATLFSPNDVAVDAANNIYVCCSNIIRKINTHTNTIEGAFSMFDRMYVGTYHFISRKHMQAYANECAYRYNTRNTTQPQRFEDTVMKCSGVRLKYNELIAE